MKNYRESSFLLLCDILYKKKLSHIAINSFFDNNEISIEDKSLIKKEVFGILENKVLIEYIINKYSNVKINKIDKKILIILYISIYEILFLKNFKSYATIDECVKLAKKYKGIFLGNFVNALSRNIYSSISYEKILEDNDISNDIKYSIPSSIFSFLLKNLNSDNDRENLIIQMFHCFNTFTHIFLRINTNDEREIKKIKDELNNYNISFIEYKGSLNLINQKVLQIDSVGGIWDLRCFKDGLISIEDISSIYFIDKLFENIKLHITHKFDLKILDCCAAPGGKISGIYHLFKNYKKDFFDNSIFIARDLIDKKIDLLIKNFAREKIKNISIMKQDAMHLDENKYDVIICDVPCSGLGVIAKKPDIKYNFKINEIESLQKLQYQILMTKSKSLNVDGIISYSTCTIDICENAKIVNDFLEKNKNFLLIDEEQILTNKNNLADGFYFAIFKRIK